MYQRAMRMVKGFIMTLPTNQILQGNSLELLKNIPHSSIDMIFADPPYYMRVDKKNALKRPEGGEFNGCNDIWDSFKNNNDYKDFSTKWLQECHRILKPNGSIWVIGSMQCIYTIGALMQEIGFWFINDIIWHKSNPTPNFHGTRLNNAHETLIWATKTQKSKYTFHYKTAKELNAHIAGFQQGMRKQLGSVWNIPICSGKERLKDSQNNKIHTTQKPEELLYRIIAISSKVGDIILDPFAGTMTTAAMAKKLGRNYIMLEQDKNYIHHGQRRLESIVFEDNAIAQAAYDKKPLKASLKDMLKYKFLFTGEDFYFKNTNIVASCTDDGKLYFKGALYNIHNLAAILQDKQAKRLNGFLHWEVLRAQKRVLLYDIREQYRETLYSLRNLSSSNL